MAERDRERSPVRRLGHWMLVRAVRPLPWPARFTKARGSPPFVQHVGGAGAQGAAAAAGANLQPPPALPGPVGFGGAMAGAAAGQVGIAPPGSSAESGSIPIPGGCPPDRSPRRPRRPSRWRPRKNVKRYKLGLFLRFLGKEL